MLNSVALVDSKEQPKLGRDLVELPRIEWHRREDDQPAPDC